MNVRKAFVGATLLFLVAGAFLLFLQQSLTPRVVSASVRQEQGQYELFLLPLAKESRGGTADIQLHLKLGALAVRKLHFQVDDCLEGLIVNGMELQSEEFPYCDYSSGVTVDLGTYVHPGMNAVQVLMTDTGGLLKFAVRVAPYHGVLGAVWVLIILLVACYGVFLVQIFIPRRNDKFPIAVFLLAFLGILLRLGYVHVTPLSMRGHDIYAHTAYVEHVMEHWTIPPAADGWEFHQPPLYYFLAAAWGRVSDALGSNIDQVFRQLQFISTLLSSTTMLLGFWIGSMLFPGRKHRYRFLLFCALIATFPGLVYFASRVSNSALYQVLLFLGMGVMLRWWRDGKTRDFVLLAVIAGVGLITSASALLLLLTALALIACTEKYAPAKRWMLGAILICVVAVIAGWLPVLRFAFEEDASRSLLLGNTEMDPQVLLRNSLRNFLTFNPLQVLEYPFNDPWQNTMRRDFFWEYFFKSAFVGEWHFGEVIGLVRQILFFGLGLIPLTVIGIVRDVRRQQPLSVPMITTGIVLLLAALAYRFHFTCACNQDYRLSSLVVIPVMYFTVRSLDAVSVAGRWVAVTWLTGLSVSSAFFVAYLTVFL